MKFILVAVISILFMAGAMAANNYSPAYQSNVASDEANGVLYPKIKENGLDPVTAVRIDLTSSSISTSAYALVTTTAVAVNRVMFTSGSDKSFKFAVGPLGAEVTQFYIPSGSITPNAVGQVNLAIPTGARVSIEPIEGTAATGAITFSFLK